MGNVHMEARQVNYRGGEKPMSVEEAIKEAGSSYVLPIAGAETLGGIKVGDNLTVEEDGTLNAPDPYIPPEYGTDEVDTGMKWIDGKTIYRKVVPCEALPNATTKNVSSGLTGVNVINMYGFAVYDGVVTIPLPYLDDVGIYYDIANNNVGIIASIDQSMYTVSYVVLEYTKVTV